MGEILIQQQWIKDELGGLYGDNVVKEIERINRLYNVYDGPGQAWPVDAALKYRPNRTITNHIKKLIKAEARFMMSRAPEIRLIPESSEDSDRAQEIEKWLLGVLNASSWQRKLIQAARDCFVGKRVAMKLSGGEDRPLRIDFRPAQEFVFETVEDDTTSLKKIVFFYQVADDTTEKEKQRIWRQRYEMVGGKCLLDEGLFDGYGKPVEITFDKFDTGLTAIPCRVIINDGLTGDLSGESDVELLMDNQETYNRMNSDDADALRFNMFPMRYGIDATEESMDKLEIAPGALADVQTDPANMGNHQAQFGIVESTFSYDQRLENRLNRTKNDMHDLLSVPNISLEQLKGLAQSGKGMAAIFWDLQCRCEEKWAEGWDDALRWMTEMLIDMAGIYGAAKLPEIPYNIRIDHLYPLPDDTEDERLGDLSEVNHQARSRKSYIAKWDKDADAEGELKQIALEKTLLEDSFTGAIQAELGAEPPKAASAQEDAGGQSTPNEDATGADGAEV